MDDKTTNGVNKMFRVVKVDGNEDFCECCGREGLSKVFWVENLETGELKHFGMYCVKSPQKGFDRAEVEVALKNYTKDQRRLKKDAERAERNAKFQEKVMEDERREEHFQSVLRGECQPNRRLWPFEQELLNAARKEWA